MLSKEALKELQEEVIDISFRWTDRDKKKAEEEGKEMTEEEYKKAVISTVCFLLSYDYDLDFRGFFIK